ncbi:MAG: ClpXP protease specificity-enhancing factor [Gammaproteobacteria bacterium]|nr:ClpXP protease specificity-enhancing factor [Gammaproteobacteria bacterium]
MTSSRPYLLRAVYDWIVDNDLTPYMLVNATLDNVAVPSEYVSNGKIILNVAPGAVQGLEMSNDNVHFNARFSGKAMLVHVPIVAVMAIYAKENGRGMVFSEEDDMPPSPNNDNYGDGEKPKSKQPTLRVVK